MSTTVDWSRWMEMSEPHQRQLMANYRDIVAREIAAAKANNWRRLDMALRYPYTWRDKVVASGPRHMGDVDG